MRRNARTTPRPNQVTRVRQRDRLNPLELVGERGGRRLVRGRVLMQRGHRGAFRTFAAGQPLLLLAATSRQRLLAAPDAQRRVLHRGAAQRRRLQRRRVANDGIPMLLVERIENNMRQCEHGRLTGVVLFVWAPGETATGRLRVFMVLNSAVARYGCVTQRPQRTISRSTLFRGR